MSLLHVQGGWQRSIVSAKYCQNLGKINLFFHFFSAKFGFWGTLLLG
jgi:hypothetical protein